MAKSQKTRKQVEELEEAANQKRLRKDAKRLRDAAAGGWQCANQPKTRRDP